MASETTTPAPQEKPKASRKQGTTLEEFVSSKPELNRNADIGLAFRQFYASKRKDFQDYESAFKAFMGGK